MTHAGAEGLTPFRRAASGAPGGGKAGQGGPGWREARFLVFDTETTGVNVTQDRVVELGAVYFEGGQAGEVRRMRINPQRPIPKEASAIHGIYDEHVRHKPTFAEVAPRFRAHLDGSARDGAAPWLVGYNASGFDVPLLNAEFARTGHAYAIDAAGVVDLMIFVRWHHRDLRSRSLPSMCQHYAIDLRNAHSAAADATATGQLLLRMAAAGLVPERADAALAEQARMQQQLEEEWRSYNYWLYHDRKDGRLRMGAGRHCGAYVDAVDADYFTYLLTEIADLPAAVRQIFEGRRRRLAS